MILSCYIDKKDIRTLDAKSASVKQQLSTAKATKSERESVINLKKNILSDLKGRLKELSNVMSYTLCLYISELIYHI